MNFPFKQHEWYKKFVELYVFSDEQEKANIRATFKHNGVDLCSNGIGAW